MEKQTRTRTRRYIKPPEYSDLPELLFTPDQLTFLVQTMTLFEQMIVTVAEPVAKVQFALATVRLAREKVSQTLRQGARGRGVAFDVNEMLVIQTSVWLFAAALETVAPSPQSELEKRQCQELCAILEPFMPPGFSPVD